MRSRAAYLRPKMRLIGQQSHGRLAKGWCPKKKIKAPFWANRKERGQQSKRVKSLVESIRNLNSLNLGLLLIIECLRIPRKQVLLLILKDGEKLLVNQRFDPIPIPNFYHFFSISSTRELFFSFCRRRRQFQERSPALFCTARARKSRTGLSARLAA